MINPFYMKDRVVWKREMPFGTIRGTRFAVLGAMVLPVALVYLLAGLFGGEAARPAWTLSAVTWFALVSLLAINAGIHVYPRERDLGALEVAALTPITPWTESVGRFRGAFIPIFEAWLMGAPYVAGALLVTLKPAFTPSDDGMSCTIPGRSQPDLAWVVAVLWLFSLLWFALLSALSLCWSTRSRTASGAFTSAMTTLLAVNLGYAVMGAWDVPKSIWMAMPLNPGAVGMLIDDGTDSFTKGERAAGRNRSDAVDSRSAALPVFEQPPR